MGARLRTAHRATDRRSSLLGLARGGARDHRACVGTCAAVGGGPLGGRRVRAEGDDPPQPGPRQEDEDRGLDREPEAGMLRVPFHRARSQPRGDEAPMKPTRAERGLPYSPYVLERLSDKSNWAPKRDPKSGSEGPNTHPIAIARHRNAGPERPPAIYQTVSPRTPSTKVCGLWTVLECIRVSTGRMEPVSRA